MACLWEIAIGGGHLPRERQQLQGPGPLICGALIEMMTSWGKWWAKVVLFTISWSILREFRVFGWRDFWKWVRFVAVISIIFHRNYMLLHITR